MEMIYDSEQYYIQHKDEITNEQIINHYWPDFLFRIKRGEAIGDIIHNIKVYEIRSAIKKYIPLYYHAFHGEYDQILASLFPLKYKGVFVEVGSARWMVNNNSYHFERNGWDCYCVEPNPIYAQQLRDNRKCKVFECAISNTSQKELQEFYIWDTIHDQSCYSGLNNDINHIHDNNATLNKKIYVSVTSLNKILPENLNIDILTIDTEGNDMNVLQGINLKKYEPKIIVVENIWDKSHREYLKNNNYIHFMDTSLDDFFYLKDVLPIK